MPAASTATATYESALARVRVNLSGFHATTTSVQVVRRRLDTGKVTLLRGARSIATPTPASDSIVLYDYEFPAGLAVRYEYFALPDLAPYDTSPSSGTYDVAGVWLKSVLRPYLNTLVTVRGYEPWSHDLRAVTYSPVRRSIPLGRADVRAGRSFAVELDGDTAPMRERLNDFLEVGGVCFWQPPGTATNLPEACYVLTTAAAERRTGRVHSARRVYALTLAEVAPPTADAAASAITWQGVVDEWATWTDVIAAKTTWADLLSTVAVPVEVVVP